MQLVNNKTILLEKRSGVDVARHASKEHCILDKDNNEYTYDISFSGTTAATGL